MRIINACLHQIDVANNECTKINIDYENEDLKIYLSGILNEIDTRPQNRKFDFDRDSTEFCTLICSSIQNDSLSSNEQGQRLASRLLSKEVAVEEEMGHLSRTGEGHIKRGSFLQFIYEDDGEKRYLGVKVDHQEYLDEDDFRKHLGLAFTKKIYKACRVNFLEDDTPSTILVYDTNTKISIYWWRDFLELKEINTNEKNTQLAFEKINRKLSIIKSISPVDYTHLRNAVITTFRQRNTVFRYAEFVENVIENYIPENDGVLESLPKLISDLKLLPEKHGFDTEFTIIPTMIKARVTKIKLGEDIELVLKDAINNLNDKIWATRFQDGKEVVIIHSPEGFKRFHFKALDQ